jgi:hypothetical protein
MIESASGMIVSPRRLRKKLRENLRKLMHRMSKPMIIIKTKDLRMLRPRKRRHPRIRHNRILRPPQNNQPSRKNPGKQIRIHNPLQNMLRHRRHTRHISTRRDNRRIQQRHMRHPDIIQRNRRGKITTQRRANKTNLLITTNSLHHTPKRIMHIKILRRTIPIHNRYCLQSLLKKKRLLPDRRGIVTMEEVEQSNTFLGGQRNPNPTPSGIRQASTGNHRKAPTHVITRRPL